MADQTFRIDADVSPFEEAMLRAQQAANRSVAEIREQFEQLNSGFGNLKTMFASVVAAFSGGEIAAKLNEIAERAEGIRKSSEIFNLSTTALQGLEAMAARTGVTSEYLQRAMATLEQKMRSAGEEGGNAAKKFNALGITTDELKDPAFSVQDALERMGASGNSSAAILAVLGARTSQLIPLMRELARNHDAAAEAARQVGALTEQEIAVLARYHGQVQTVNTEWANFTSRILGEAAPALGELQQQLFNVLTAGRATGEIAETARAVSAEFLEWATAAKDLYADLTHIFVTIGTSLGNVAAVFAAAATGHFARAKEIWQEGTADLAEIDKEHDDQIKANHAALAQALQAIDQSILQPVDVTARYKNVTPLPDLGTEKLIRLSDKWAEREIADANKVLDTMKKVAEDKLQAAEDTALGQVEAGEKALSEELRSGQVSASQFLAQENALISQRLAILRAYYAEKSSLAVGDEAEQAKIQTEIAKAEADALKRRQVAENEAREASLAQWKNLASRMESSFASSITGMIERTKTFAQGVRGIFSSLIDGIIQIFVKMAIQWVENMILGKTAAAGQISANAGVAATAAMGSVAAIPFYGWAAAPAVGATTFAEAMGYEGAAAAERGYDIPANVNPTLQAHAREMVLSPYLSDRIRNMTSQPAEGGGVSEHHSYNGDVRISALDTRSVAQMMRAPGNRRALANAVRQYVRRGGR